MEKSAKILITGGKGQLGTELSNELFNRGYTNIKSVDIDELDITDEIKVHHYINEFKPKVIFHCAAFTNVDGAEKNSDLVYKINYYGTKYISEAAKEVDSVLVYLSTDYVFDGRGELPFEVNDKKGGLSIYGKSKSLGEDIVQITLKKYFLVRISWVFGKFGKNFVGTMLNLAAKGLKEINVVNDQIGSVTYTYDLSNLLIDMIETEKYGVYHATNEGYISWYEFALEIFKLKNIEMKVNPISTREYQALVPNQASRPLNSRLSKRSLDEAGFNRLPDWKDALKRYLEEIK